MDHRGPEFAKLAKEVLSGLQGVFLTKSPVIIYPRVRHRRVGGITRQHAVAGRQDPDVRDGHFATLWREMATRLGFQIDFVAGDWRHGADPAVVYAKLADDRDHQIKAVAVVHNETSTGVVSRMPTSGGRLMRRGIQRSCSSIRSRRSALSSTAMRLGRRRDDRLLSERADAAAGLGFNAISEKAIAASKTARMPRAYWDWEPMLRDNKAGYFPYTPSTNLLYGLREAIKMLMDEGLENIFARHERFGRATRAP
jgi:alanine-glyoxylate transaminase/serine-glyoxylate transaminase/serine-pyruvate transaminase